METDQKKRILIADRADFMRKMIENILEPEGVFEVVGEASDGIEAVEKFEELEPDLAFIDVVMPKRSATDVIKSIIEKFPDAKIILCAALGQEDSVIDGMNAGAADRHIVKPYTPEKLLKTVYKVLEIDPPRGQLHLEYTFEPGA